MVFNVQNINNGYCSITGCLNKNMRAWMKFFDNKGNDMQATKKNSDRRLVERLELTLQMLLFDQSGKAVNVSAEGVYFELITEDIEPFSTGATIPIQITAETSAIGIDKRKVKLNGTGTVIRNMIKNVTSHGSELGVAVQFNKPLDVTI